MRDPNRIPKLLKAIERLWLEVPDWRLGQLLCNVYPRFESNPFFIEDDEILKAIKDEIKDCNHCGIDAHVA